MAHFTISESEFIKIVLEFCTYTYTSFVFVFCFFCFFFLSHGSKKLINPCHAVYIKIPRPLLIFSQSDNLIWVVDINSHT